MKGARNVSGSISGTWKKDCKLINWKLAIKSRESGRLEMMYDPIENALTCTEHPNQEGRSHLSSPGDQFQAAAYREIYITQFTNIQKCS